MALSFATVAELWRGAYAKDYNPDSRRRLDAAIRQCVVIPPTQAVTDRWGRLADTERRAGRALGGKEHAHDAWIAATALVHDLPLFTNDGHFADVPGLQLFERVSSDQ